MLKAKIIKTKKGKQGGVFAQVETEGKQIISNVLLIFQHNTATNPLIKDKKDSNLVYLLRGYQNDLLYGLPYNPLLEDSLKPSEYKAGNLEKGSFIFFDENGNVVIDSKLSKISLNNDLETLNSLITQLIVVLQNFISVDNPITPTITVQPSTATQNAITTLQTNFNKLIS
jgi:hypothetical protein